MIALVAFICLLNSEDYREDRTQKQKIILIPLVIGMILMSFALGLGQITTWKQLTRILGSDTILFSYNCFSPVNNDFRRKRAASSLTVTEQLKDQHYRAYMGYLTCISII